MTATECPTATEVTPLLDSHGTKTLVNIHGCENQALRCLASMVHKAVGMRMQAVQEMHEPSSHVELEEARRRLAFEELLLLQLTLLLRRELSRCAQLPHSAP